ncbi:MAG: hypothetical protein KAG53_02730 [Endozoicomonadaceae bacterium]|nr:hypothetical protein [Endozoicomonadaceae bacterium]
MKRFIVITILAIILHGCATPYQQEKGGNGYSETRLNDNTFNVVFKGSSNTDRDRVADFVLLRSAELTLEHGYRYFAIIDTRDDTKYVTRTTPITHNTHGSDVETAYGNSFHESTLYTGLNVRVDVSPILTYTITCFDEELDSVFNYNAMFIYRNIREKYGITLKS